MSRKLITAIVSVVAMQGAALGQGAVANEATPGYNTKTPKSIMTPNKVETRTGIREFFAGIPRQS